jgi:hypothetical protein
MSEDDGPGFTRRNRALIAAFSEEKSVDRAVAGVRSPQTHI